MNILHRPLHGLSAAVMAIIGHSMLPAFAGMENTGQVEVQTLDEVRVMAERRSQNLQQVPIAATVISADDLKIRGIASVHDLIQAAPSLAVGQANRSTFINIRGVGLAQRAPNSSPGVAWYIDGQLVPQEQSIVGGFYDVESIEVLRGPQGTLSGQNSTGGAINLRTPDPFSAGGGGGGGIPGAVRR